MKMITLALLQSICAVRYVYNSPKDFVAVSSTVHLAMRFDWLEVAEREIVNLFWDMSRSDVSSVIFQKLMSDKHLSDMRSTWCMHVNADFVLFLVNYVSNSAVETIYMAWTLAKTTFAGAPIITSSLRRC
jgi:hypothetical protein